MSENKIKEESKTIKENEDTKHKSAMIVSCIIWLLFCCDSYWFNLWSTSSLSIMSHLVFTISFATFIPSVTLPNAAYWPSRWGEVSVMMKSWQEAVIRSWASCRYIFYGGNGRLSRWNWTIFVHLQGMSSLTSSIIVESCRKTVRKHWIYRIFVVLQKLMTKTLDKKGSILGR